MSVPSGTLERSYFEKLKNEATWGTYGKGGVEHCAGRCPEHRLKWKKLVDCDTEHLQAILRTQRQIRYHLYRMLIEDILKERGVKPEQFSDEAEREMYDKVIAAERQFPQVGTIEETNATRQEGQ